MVAERRASSFLLACVTLLAACAARAAPVAAAARAAGDATSAAPSSAAAAEAANVTWWRPRLGYRFQYVLKMRFDPSTMFRSNVQVYLFDGWEASADDVAALKAKGGFGICYFSAGSYEDWRPDKGAFLPSDYKNPLVGWPGEYWIDVRSANVKTIMRKRMEMCKAKGFVGLDPDNVDGYSNNNGLGLTYADQLAYNTWIAATAHELGLAVGLKNDLDQVADLVNDFDYFVNEQCMQYNECGMYAPVKAASKPVWSVEYKKASFDKACPKQLDYGIRTLYKADPNLSDDWQECTGINYPDSPAGPGTNGTTNNGTDPSNNSNGTWWRPRAADGQLFNLQPGEPFSAPAQILPGTSVYILDADTTTASAVSAITAAGGSAACRFAAGTVVRAGRKDVAGNLVASDYGKKAKGKSYYLDITSATVKARAKQLMEGCKAKGFAAVAPSDVDTYGRNHGFSFDAPQQIAFNKWLAATAHGLGLAAGLTNDVDQVADLATDFDFFVNENCAKQGTCNVYKAAAGKPVFQVEYSSTTFAKACRCQAQLGMTSIRKKASLNSWRQLCSDLPSKQLNGGCGLA